MKVRKFSANTSREALRMVREALGDDAVILSNRTVNGKVEIMALAGEDMSSLAEPAVEREVRHEPLLASFSSKPKPVSKPMQEPVEPVRSFAADLDLAAAREAADRELKQVMAEIRSMRGMMEAQLAEISWGSQQQREPFKAEIMREMLAAGFSATLARYLTENLPENEKMHGGMSWVKSILARNLMIMKNENEILDKGGVYALVGPTGVGKTTTTAKLAARCVMQHGANKLALITTDGYRIGGYEQLRIYGKILGVMVHSVKDEADLRIALDELRGKHMVLIDTVGVSQRDKMVTEQIAMLSSAGVPVQRLLCLAATSTGETLNEVVRAYKGDGLAGCIMTKLDEAATIGSALDVMIRQKMMLYYVANGQRVPEDLHLANQHYLIDRAFKLKRETAPFRYQDDELPLVVANTARAVKENGLREVFLG
ncbi:MAG: putative flagellar biosynthesis regulator FlhF [Burkholderiaceae bacterium]|nr:putative flagellar biosynthesis regulator FlhF [Burkholderiaceae bacterium]